MKPFITAIRTLTIIPIPGKDTCNFALCLLCFPFVGLLLAGVAWLTYWIGLSLFSSQYSIIALTVATVMIAITGGIHLDGFADIADGFGGGRSKERILEIFKDPRLGSYGVTAIALDIATKIILYASLLQLNHFEIIAISLVLSRSVQSIGCAFFPYARLNGGTGAPFVGAFKMRIPVSINLLAIIIFYGAFFGVVQTVLMFLLMSICCFLFFMKCKRKIDGITGDCLGAVNEIAEMAILVAGMISITVFKNNLISFIF